MNPLGNMIWEKSFLYVLLYVLGDDLENGTPWVLQCASIGASEREVAWAIYS